MCGIAGQLSFGDQPVDKRLVKRMTSRLAHRGPDGFGYYFDGQVGLGHRRLAIIDLESGAQPMSTVDGRLSIVANNEIYNYLELRSELEANGSSFRTSSDTEVILNLFEHSGERSFSRLEGMFALALWDARSQTLFLARDPFGIKPLYYYHDANTLLFASEMKALLEYAPLNTTLDVAALNGFFRSLALPEPNSIFKNVKKVPVGHFVCVQKGRVRLERYWQPRFAPAIANGAAAEAQVGQRLRDELDKSVRISLRSDVPVGLLLSGGVDSSSIAAFAARRSGTRLHTFSATFDENEFNEGEYGKLVAKKFGTKHHEIRVTKRLATNIAERLSELLDEPFADSSSIPTYAVCKLAAGHVKTVLSGEGADELFGGYPWHVARKPGRALDHEAIVEHPSRVVFSLNERMRMYSNAWRTELKELRPTSTFESNDRLSTLNRFLLDDLKYYLPSDILFKSDRVSMMHSLEVRVPFLNRGFAELALRLPSRLKVNGSVRKYALKQAMGRLLPRAVLQRPKKGFAIPMELWLWEKGKWRDMVYDVVFSKRTREREQFDMRFLETLQLQHERLEGLHGYKFWTVFTFEMWQRRFLDRR